MFILLFDNGKPMKCSDGNVYIFETSKAAANIVDICYGHSAFKAGWIKIKRVHDLEIYKSRSILS